MLSTTNLTLVGFVVEAEGNEGHLVMAEPVLSIDGHDYVAPKLSWSVDDLRPLRNDETNFVSWLQKESHRPIHQGEIVWVAGRNFYADLSPAFLELQLEVGEWPLFKKGIRWTTGTLRNFMAFHRRLSAGIERSLALYLFDPIEKSMGSADEVFRLYTTLAVPMTVDRDLWYGVYFDQKRDQRAFRMAGRLAVRAGRIGTYEDYEVAVHAKLGWMLNRRLSERTPVPSSVGAAHLDATRSKVMTWIEDSRDRHSRSEKSHVVDLMDFIDRGVATR